MPQDVVRKVPREELEHIVESIYPHEVESEHLDEWLAGPEAEGPEYTEAYLAFTELRLVFDSARWILKHWDEVHQEPDG